MPPIAPSSSHSKMHEADLIDLSKVNLNNKLFYNHVTRRLMSIDYIESHKLKAGLVTIATGLVIMGAVAGITFLGFWVAVALGGPLAIAIVGKYALIFTVAKFAGIISGGVVFLALASRAALLFKEKFRSEHP